MQLLRLPSFDAAMKQIRDARARAKILIALQRMGQGNAGDSKSLGNGLFECRIHHGPGYRIYYTRRGADVVLLLLCGSKGAQAGDIDCARKLMR